MSFRELGTQMDHRSTPWSQASKFPTRHNYRRISPDLSYGSATRASHSITQVAYQSMVMQHGKAGFYFRDRSSHSPFSRNLNSIVPDSGLFDPSRVIFGLNGAHVWPAREVAEVEVDRILQLSV